MASPLQASQPNTRLPEPAFCPGGRHCWQGLPWHGTGEVFAPSWAGCFLSKPPLPSRFPLKKELPSWASMGKSLIKIRTRVHVQLRLTNHCLRPLSIRILRMGPRLQARILTVPPGPLGATSGQRHPLEHLQGKYTRLAVPLSPSFLSTNSSPRHPPPDYRAW